jgi:hypothetical protein
MLMTGGAAYQSLVCGIAVSTPTGLGTWNSFDTKVSDSGNGDERGNNGGIVERGHGGCNQWGVYAANDSFGGRA